MVVETLISRAILSDTVKDRLLEAILDGRYPPGSRIIETRAAREFGTSQTPVREALRDLEAIGVVEIAAFRGARVRHPSPQELLEAYAVRSELEALAMRLAVPRLTDDDVTTLTGHLDAMTRAAEAGDIVAEAAADAGFHGHVIHVANNGTLERAWRQLEPYLRTYISLAVPGADRRRIAGLHDPVLVALRERDAGAAEAAMRHHFHEAEAMLAGLLTESGPGDSGAHLDIAHAPASG